MSGTRNNVVGKWLALRASDTKSHGSTPGRAPLRNNLGQVVHTPYASDTKQYDREGVGALSDDAVRPSVCLSYAHRVKTVRYRHLVTINRDRNQMLKVEPTGQLYNRRKWPMWP